MRLGRPLGHLEFGCSQLLMALVIGDVVGEAGWPKAEKNFNQSEKPVPVSL